MRASSTPELGPRYWVILCAASVAGCNLGDFVSLYLHLGHWKGLFPLALVFAAILVAENREGAAEAWYWAAVISVRTAATNVADLATHTFNLDYSWVIAALELLQVLVVLGTSVCCDELARGRFPKPVPDAWYWASMLVAGTLGTAIGDGTAEVFHFGTGWGTVALSVVLAFTLTVGFLTGWTKASYWFAVIAIRAAGTTAGDWFAFSDGSGIGLGLPVSLCISCGVFIAIPLLWRPSLRTGLRTG